MPAAPAAIKTRPTLFWTVNPSFRITAALSTTAGAPMASEEDLLRIHPQSYLRDFKRLSDAGGGDLGDTSPFGVTISAWPGPSQ